MVTAVIIAVRGIIVRRITGVVIRSRRAASESLSDGTDNHQQHHEDNNTDHDRSRNTLQEILNSGHVFGRAFLTGRSLGRIIVIVVVLIVIDVPLTFDGIQSFQQRLLDVIGIDGLTAFGQVFVHHIQDLVPFGIRIDRLCIIGSPYVIISGRIALEIKIDTFPDRFCSCRRGIPQYSHSDNQRYSEFFPTHLFPCWPGECRPRP